MLVCVFFSILSFTVSNSQALYNEETQICFLYTLDKHVYLNTDSVSVCVCVCADRVLSLV